MSLAWLLAALLVAAAPAAPAAADRSWEAKLQGHLLYRADGREPPALANATEVQLKLLLKVFFYDAREEQISIVSWLIRDWVDVRLAWDPAAFGDIEETLIRPDLVWVPSIKVRNAFRSYQNSERTECRVRHSGAVKCQSKVLYAVLCARGPLAAWPYDARTCRFELDYGGRGSAALTFGDRRGVSMLGAEYGPAWTVTDYAQRERGAGGRLWFSLTLEREGAALGALTAGPALALSALSLLAAALPALSLARAPLAAFSLAAHFVLLQILSEAMPPCGRDSPTILLYVRVSIAVTTASLVAGCGLRRLARAGRAPQWMARLNAAAARSPARLALPPRTSPDTLADAVAKRHEAELIDFVSLCGVLDFVIEGIIYFTLYLIYVPQPPPFT